MVTVRDCSIVLGPVRQQKRAVRVVLTVHSADAVPYTHSRLTLRLHDARGNILADVPLEGPPVSPGAQVLTFHASLPAVDLGAAEGTLDCWRGEGAALVSGITPFQAPKTTPKPRPEAAPAPSTPKPQPARQPPPWERFAVKRAAASLKAAPTVDPSSPWTKLDAGDLEGALAAFDRHRLGEVGQHRLRALMASTDPAELALGCQISRLVRWVTASAMVPLLSHADARVRREAVDSLGRVAGRSSVDAVAPLLDDSDPDVKAAAELCMARITGNAPRW